MVWKVLATSGFFASVASIGWSIVRERRLNRQCREQTLFYASLGHELKTPLNAIIGFAELLQSGECTLDEQRQFAQNIAFSAHTQLGMINNMLDNAKLNAGQMQLHPRPTDFKEFTHQLQLLLFPLLHEKELRLDIRLSSDLPQLIVDPNRIRQILLNLIGNAIKFSQKSVIELHVDFQPETGVLTLLVVDHGPGIPEEYQKKIFEPFIQQPNHAIAGLGTGLGLSISTQLIRLMNGTIALDSRPGEGSRFTVTLPVGQSKP